MANQENWINGFRTIDDGRTSVANYVWDTGSLSWVVQTGGGAGPASDVNIISSITLPISAASLPLPTGASTEATLSALNAKFSALGQNTMALSAPVVIASNQSSIPVTLASTTITGSVAVTGPLTDAQLRASAVPVSLASTTITGSVAVTGPLTDAQLRASAVPVSFAATAGSKALNVQVVGADLGVITNSVIHALTSAGGGTYVDVKATPSGALVTAPASPTANARTSVAGAAVDTLILASNTSRLGATVFNDSTAILYLALGTAAASLTDYTVQMVAKAYYEVPYNYTGQIRGIWASATGSARIGELT